MATSAVAVAAAVLVVPLLPGRDGHTAFGWKPNGNNRVVPDPLVTMQTQLHLTPQAQLFQVTSTAPSYWRLTSLNYFDGDTWSGTYSYSGFGSKLPGVPGRARVGLTKATFRIEQLDSVWLPDQYNPISVVGVHRVSYDASSNSLIASKATPEGLTYTVTSYRYLASLSTSDLEEAPAVSRAPAVATDLELPASVSSRVRELAARLTSGQPTEYAKALAIQDFLRGPQFRYSLDPPSDGSSQQALDNFLFVTRTGYCQQFAGAFAVLARAAGLPTRLAVGYTTGTAIGDDGYQVTGADAHTWPEVYFGSGIGWVPFEPTPGFAVPGSTGYDPVSAGDSGRGSAGVTAPATGDQGVRSSSGRALPGSSGPSAAPATEPALVPATRASRSHQTVTWWILAILVAAVAVAGCWVTALAMVRLVRRRLRRKRAERTGPAEVVLTAWSEVKDELSWRQVVMEPAETVGEFTARAVERLEGGELTSGLARLAGLADRAVYGTEVSSADATTALLTADTVRHGLRTGASRGERAARRVSPRRNAGATAERGRRPGRRPSGKRSTG